MSALMTPRDEVLELLRENGRMPRKELLIRSTLVEDSEQLSTILHGLLSDGWVQRCEGSDYDLTERGRAVITTPPMSEPQDAIASTQAATPTLADAIQAAGNGKVGEILARAAQQAQDALDEYVWEIGDERILGPLMASRDAAREAMAAYRERRT